MQTVSRVKIKRIPMKLFILILNFAKISSISKQGEEQSQKAVTVSPTYYYSENTPYNVASTHRHTCS